MKEIEILPGDRIDLACARLVKEAPAHMIFNGTDVCALPGESAKDVYEKWCLTRAIRTQPEPVDELAKLRAENERLRAALGVVARAENAAQASAEWSRNVHTWRWMLSGGSPSEGDPRG